jgi:hypothetical protein
MKNFWFSRKLVFSLATGADPREKEGRRKNAKHMEAREVSKQNVSSS